MKRIAQKNYKKGDCGTACIATIAHLEYQTVKDAFIELGIFRKHGPYFTFYHDIIRVLKHFGFKVTVKEFTSWDDIEGNAIVKVNARHNGYYWRWHWVVFHKTKNGPGVILDPKPRSKYKEPMEPSRRHKGSDRYILVEEY